MNNADFQKKCNKWQIAYRVFFLILFYFSECMWYPFQCNFTQLAFPKNRMGGPFFSMPVSACYSSSIHRILHDAWLKTEFGVHGAIGCGQKKIHASVAVPAASVRVPGERPLAPSVASVTSVANNRVILGAVHRSPGICLIVEENPRKPELRDRLMKGLCDQSSPQMGPFTPNEVSKIAQHVKKGEGRK